MAKPNVLKFANSGTLVSKSPATKLTAAIVSVPVTRLTRR